MHIYRTNLKDDIEEEYLEAIQEEIQEVDLYDLSYESVMDKVLEKYDYEFMDDYIRDHIEDFEIEENDDLIDRLATHIVEEELPTLKDEIIVESQSTVDEYIEQKQENDLNNVI